MTPSHPLRRRAGGPARPSARPRDATARLVVVVVAVAAALQLAGAGCAAPRMPLGSQCVFNGDCADPLVCAAHVCRAQCRDDRDCVNGWHCSPSGQRDKRVCLPPDAPVPCVYSCECPSPLVCTRDGFCSPQCRGPDASRDCVLEDPAATCLPYQPPPGFPVGDGSAIYTCSFHPIFDGGTPGSVCAPDAGATE